MKIWRNQRTAKGIYPLKQGKKSVVPAGKAAYPVRDIVLTGFSGRVEALVQQIRRYADFRGERVKRIRHEILSREYHLSAEAVAEAILREIAETSRLGGSPRE
ncbi:MAG: flagellar biosynthesis anti-sigma factor FlgM [bacterium]|nr:flagellar biosynthesis anti-sigma factor FlgM [bacterium]